MRAEARKAITMPLPIKKASSAESLATIANVLIATFVVAVLWFGRDLLVPFALAALLTFMLAPLVTRLQRWLGRIGAVLLVVIMLVTATGAAGWVLTRQAVDLANSLPDYKENIRAKMRSVSLPEDGPFSRFSRTVDELKKDLPGNGNDSLLKTESAKQGGDKVTPVKVVNSGQGGMEFAQGVLAPILGPLGTASLVLLLLIFMLLQREDLRNRFIRLAGQGRISATSLAMDDAASRVSRYLRMQLVVNVTYGIPVAIGLYFLGVPNAILWGTLATVLRFIPYVGPWIAAAFPVIISLAVSPGWTTPLLVIGLFVVLELLSNNIMEPWLYGSSTGVSPVALIVAALVWTSLWGPVGLVLATPLTVCMVVMGRHIPKLSFLSIMLSDDEPLTPAQDCYHRLHRSGENDEMELVDQFLKGNSPAALFDTVLIPVITAAETDHRLGHLETDQLQYVEQGLTEILDDLESRREELPPERGFHVACIPARAHRDEIAGEMLLQLLRTRGLTTTMASSRMLSGELAGWVRNTRPDLVCISAVLPTSATHARYVCMKLRRQFPDLKIITGLWGFPKDSQENTALLREAGANGIVTTVMDACDQIEQYAPPVTGIENVAQSA